MRRGVLWYEMRELGVIALLTPLFVVAGVALFAGMMTLGGAQSEQIANVLTRSMEILYPLAAGTVAATIVAADPGVEWQLTMPTPYRVTVFRRLMIVLVWSALVAFGDVVVLRIIGRWIVPRPFIVSQLMWLSPMLSFAALGALLALARPQPLGERGAGRRHLDRRGALSWLSARSGVGAALVLVRDDLGRRGKLLALEPPDADRSGGRALRRRRRAPTAERNAPRGR